MAPPTAPDAAATTDPLDGLTVAVPCTVSWESMRGDARRRFCGSCRLHVHDLSAMTRDEALAFLAARPPGERLCGRFFRRPDGRVLTRDCRAAVRALRRRALLVTAALLGAVGLGGVVLAAAREDDGTTLWDRQPFATLARYLPASWLPAQPRQLMGELCLPAPPQGTTPTPDGG
jgi:hypothetical protein